MIQQTCRYKGKHSNDILAIPGQFASFDFQGIPGKEGETLNRTWTISSTPEEMEAKQHFTITAKKVRTLKLGIHSNTQKIRTGREPFLSV